MRRIRGWSSTLSFLWRRKKIRQPLFWVGVLGTRSPMENGSPAIMVLATACLGAWKPHNATGGMSVNPVFYTKLPYDLLKDFVPISLMGSFPLVLVVHPSAPANSVQERRRRGARHEPGARRDDPGSRPRADGPHGVGDEARGFCERSGDGSAAIRRRRHLGVPNRIRTGVTAVKERLKRPLDDGDLEDSYEGG